MSTPLNIVIAGGGVTGLTCAALLAQSDVAAGFDLTLVDAGERGRVGTHQRQPDLQHVGVTGDLYFAAHDHEIEAPQVAR